MVVVVSLYAGGIVNPSYHWESHNTRLCGGEAHSMDSSRAVVAAVLM